jgi:hypothetical protein
MVETQILIQSEEIFVTSFMDKSPYFVTSNETTGLGKHDDDD